MFDPPLDFPNCFVLEVDAWFRPVQCSDDNTSHSSNYLWMRYDIYDITIMIKQFVSPPNDAANSKPPSSLFFFIFPNHATESVQHYHRMVQQYGR